MYPTQNRTRRTVRPGGARAAPATTLSRVDLFRWERQLLYQLFPVYVNLATSKPAVHGAFPEPVVLPPPLNLTGPI